MASTTLSTAVAVPRATFTHHSLQLQIQRRLASSSSPPTNTPFPPGLFRPPHSIIKPWRAVAGAQEWQTSAYHYNKNTIKSLPTASVTASNLLKQYATMIKQPGVTEQSFRLNGPETYKGEPKSWATSKRRSEEVVYVSGARVKDFGDRMEVRAFVYDGLEAAKEERERERLKRQAEREKKRAEGGLVDKEGQGRGRRPGFRRGVGGFGAGRGGAPRFGAGAGGQGGGTGFRRVNLGRA
jgi:hypothetical protein